MNPGRGRHPLVGIGITQNVQPVAGVTDAVLVAGQQFVHHFFISAGRFVIKKSFLLGWRGRDANQIQVYPAKQCQLVCRAGRTKALRLIVSRDEGIDWVGGFGNAGGNLWANDGFQNPQRGSLPTLGSPGGGGLRRKVG